MIYLIPSAILTVLNLTFAAVGPRRGRLPMEVKSATATLVCLPLPRQLPTPPFVQSTHIAKTNLALQSSYAVTGRGYRPR